MLNKRSLFTPLVERNIFGIPITKGSPYHALLERTTNNTKGYIIHLSNDPFVISQHAEDGWLAASFGGVKSLKKEIVAGPSSNPHDLVMNSTNSDAYTQWLKEV